MIGAPEGWSRQLERSAVWEQAEASAELTRLPLDRAALVDADVRALQGYVEAEERLAPLLTQAAGRIRAAFAALHDELARKPDSVSSATSGS